ncbi:MAG: EI24 domain-containing protein [Bacteroidota bacterium]|nr:EI24 domain-containing protein [Bacteroidota bacterium]
MLEQIIIAIDSYFKAHRFIMKNKLLSWILIPGIFYAILFVSGLYFFWHSAAFMVEYFLSKTGLKHWLQKENTSWLSFIFIFGQIVLQLILMMFYFSWFKYLILIIGSPLFAYLTEKTEAITSNKKYLFSIKRFFNDAIRGIRIALRNTLWQTVYTVSILFLALIPVLGWVTPLLALFIEFYYFGFSMLDYTSERKGLSSAESIDFINHHKGLAIGNGMIFYLMHLLPIVGWIFAPGYSVIAATLSLQQKESKRVDVTFIK